MPLEADEIEHLQQGMQQFRAGNFFAAHDDWEAVWQGLRGRPRTFWQAMIQLVVGAYHLKNGNRKGCNSQWNKALMKCQELIATYDDHVPQQLPLLEALLRTSLASLHHAEDPLPHLAHFANTVLSDAWFEFH